MKRFKTAACLILAALLIAGVLPLGSFAAGTVDSAALVGYEIPVSGQTAGAAALPVLADDTLCEIDGYAWYCDTDGTSVTSGNVFVRTKMYSLNVSIRAKDGYTFSDAVAVTVNGGTDLIDFDYCSISEGGKKLSLWTVPAHPLSSGETEHIYEINVNNFVKPFLDSTPQTTGLPTVSAYDAYTAVDAYWFCDTDGAQLSENGFFESGKLYSLCMTFEPIEGFDFAEELTFSVNGSSDFVNAGASLVESPSRAFLRTVPVNALRELIANVTVNGYLPPLLGKSVAEMPALTAPEDASYSVSGYTWICETDGGVSLDPSYVFEAGKIYYVTVDIDADSDCEFTASLNFGFSGTVDWDRTVIGVSHISLASAATAAYTGVITSVNVTGYEKPVVGQAVADMSAPSAPDGAHYGVSSVKWYCDTTSRYMGSSDTFISGNQYSLYLQITADAGYCFSADAALYVNGDNGDIDEYYSGVISVNTVGIWTVPDYPVGSLGSDITAINVLGSVTPYAGKTPEDIISTLSVPGGAEYSVLGGNWYYISDEEEFWVMPPQEEFEAGKRYVLIVYVQANEGHCFNASTEVMINGSSDLIDFSATEIEASEVTEGMDYRIQTLPFTVGTPVTEVAVTGYQTPKIGQTVADNIVNITVSDNCTVWNVGWTSDTTGDTLGDDDIFEEGAVYYMYFNLDAADGYAFDTDNLPAITINGDTYLLDDTFTRFNDTHLVFFTINVEPTEDTGKEMIYEVELNGFEKPKAGQTFGELKAALTVPEGAHYTLTEVACYSHADDEFMDDDDVYEAGNNYFFSFMFAPDEGYDFDVDAGLPIPYLNGGSDLIYDFMTSFYIDDDGGFLFGFGTVYLEVEAPEINYGDVNNDGKIDGKDLIRLRKYLVGADVEIFPGADVNGDGEINGKDLIRLRKYLLTEDASLLGPQ